MLTSRLFRVFPWLPRAAPGEPGHPLYLSPRQGAGRVDNPEHYLTLYASDSPVGAVAEAFGNHAIWTPELLRGRPDLPGSVRALACLELRRSRTLDLDEPRELVERKLRPSVVVSRDRAATQAWALSIWRERRWAGVRWWSRYDSRWGAFGIWATGRLDVTDVASLRADHPALLEARDVLARPGILPS